MSDVKLLRHVKREMAEPELSYRPLLNLIVILSNVFGDGVEGLVFSAIEQDRWKLVPFLDKIGRLRRYNVKLADGSRINLPYDPREDAISDKLSTI